MSTQNHNLIINHSSKLYNFCVCLGGYFFKGVFPCKEVVTNISSLFWFLKNHLYFLTTIKMSRREAFSIPIEATCRIILFLSSSTLFSPPSFLLDWLSLGIQFPLLTIGVPEGENGWIWKCEFRLCFVFFLFCCNIRFEMQIIPFLFVELCSSALI